MKNKLYSDAEFQESLDRSLSSLQPDRLMARRIIASGKEEEKVKKIPRLAIVIAVILVLTMATAIAAHIAGWTNGLEERLQEGLVEEIQGLLDSGIPADDLIYYGLEYKFVTQYVLGQLSYDDMVIALGNAIHQFAKRQMTWFRGMERDGVRIHWVRP